MNKDRRADIERARVLLNEARSIIEAARDGEQEYFDNIPEGLQNSERGERANETIEVLTDIADVIEGFDFDGVLA